MRMFLSALVCLLASPVALADLTPGEGEGYYGTAWYDDNSGSVVYEQSYSLCAQRLQDAIDQNVNVWGKSVVSINPCSYRPPHAAYQVLIKLEVASPGGGQGEAGEILSDYTQLRRLHDIDGFEAAVRRMVGGDE